MIAECVTRRWVDKSTRLKFSLGGFLFCASRFKASVLDGYLPADPLAPLDSTAGVRALLVPSSPVEKPLPCMSFTDELIRYVPAQYRRFYLDLDGTFEDYSKRFSSARRKHLRRQVKDLAAANGGTVEWAEYRHQQEMAEYHRLPREVSPKPYTANL